jgi:hypothetical protein
VAYNSTIVFSNFNEFNAKSNFTSEFYALTHYNAMGVSYNIIGGLNYFISIPFGMHLLLHIRS